MKQSLWFAFLLAAPAGAQSVPASFDCEGHFTQLVVPTGFCTRIFADSIGAVRQIVVHPTGQLVAATNESPGLVRMRPSATTGKAEQVVRFGPGQRGTGVTWRNGWLYFAADSGVIRYRWGARSEAPEPRGEWIVRGLPVGLYGSAHTMKGVAVDNDGSVYVSIGSESDNCQERDRASKSPGKWPCDELERRAGVWRYSPPSEVGAPWASQRFATGLRNAEALAFDPTNDKVWGATQGRDYLNRMWGWSDSTSANQPAEMLEQIVGNADYGWPFCQGFWTRGSTRLVKTPDYATQALVDCTLKTQPVMGFPGHWAPMAIAVVNAAPNAIPHPGLFIAFHGSRGRYPLPEEGHLVEFVPMDENGRIKGDPRVFLYSRSAPGTIRPAGVAVGVDGMIYVSDDEHRRIILIEPHAPGKP